MQKIKPIKILILILGLYSCEPINQIPDKKEITNLIIETIRLDSLDLRIPVDLNLENRYICQLEYRMGSGYLPPPPANKNGYPFVFSQYKSKTGNSFCFNENDSTFVADQVIKNKNITLEINLFPENILINTTSKQKNKGQKLYKFLIPLLNKNMDFAIVEYNFQCAGCGYGKFVSFRKTNAKWNKVESFVTWIN